MHSPMSRWHSQFPKQSILVSTKRWLRYSDGSTHSNEVSYYAVCYCRCCVLFCPICFCLSHFMLCVLDTIHGFIKILWPLIYIYIYIFPRSAYGSYCIKDNGVPFCPSENNPIGDPRCCIGTQSLDEVSFRSNSIETMVDLMKIRDRNWWLPYWSFGLQIG